MELAEYLTFQNILTVVATLFGGGSLLMYREERKKRKLLNKKTEVEILNQFQELYKDMVEDLNPHHEILREQNKELREILKNLKNEN